MKALHVEKKELSQILRMLVGLRKSWAESGSVIREDSAEYSTQGDGIDKARDKEKTPGKPGSTNKQNPIWSAVTSAANLPLCIRTECAKAYQPSPVHRAL